MRDLGDVLADLSNSVDDDRSAHLYSSLAPVYDFMYERHFDYDAQFGVVTENAPDDAESVLEVGCGTGRLLAKLDEHYEEAVGLERSEAMARRARQRTDEAAVVVGDATSPPLGEDESASIGLGGENSVGTHLGGGFDAVVVLGRVTGHVTEEGAAERFAENCLDALGPVGDSGSESGVLLFDYFPTERMEDDHRSADSFEGERYRVDRETHSAIPESDGGPDVVETTFEYEIADRETGESAAVSETMALRMFTEREIRDLLGDAGFADVTVREEGADGWPLVVARSGGTDGDESGE